MQRFPSTKSSNNKLFLNAATLRSDSRIALNLEGVDIGSRGTLHADECVHVLERAIDGLREDFVID